MSETENLESGPPLDRMMEFPPPPYFPPTSEAEITLNVMMWRRSVTNTVDMLVDDIIRQHPEIVCERVEVDVTLTIV